MHFFKTNTKKTQRTRVLEGSEFTNLLLLLFITIRMSNVHALCLTAASMSL